MLDVYNAELDARGLVLHVPKSRQEGGKTDPYQRWTLGDPGPTVGT